MTTKKRPKTHDKKIGGTPVKVSKGEKVDLYSQYGYDEVVGRNTVYSKGRGSGNPAISKEDEHNLYAREAKRVLHRKPR